MTFGQWFSFQGRIRRKTWWLAYVLPLVALSIVASIIDLSLGFVTVSEDAAPADGFSVSAQGIGPFSLLALIPSIWGGLAGQVKRWHDRDKVGWWVLINFIPLVGPIWALVETGFLSGTPGPNRFGPDPKGGAGAAQWQGAPPPGSWQPQQPQQWQPQPQWQQPPQQWQQPQPPQWQPPPRRRRDRRRATASRRRLWPAASAGLRTAAAGLWPATARLWPAAAWLRAAAASAGIWAAAAAAPAAGLRPAAARQRAAGAPGVAAQAGSTGAAGTPAASITAPAASSRSSR